VKQVLLLMIILFSFKIKAIVYEMDVNFGYDKQIFGSSRQNSNVSRTYAGGISAYLFELTAIDLNYSEINDRTSYNDRFTATTGIDVISTRTNVSTSILGLGLKQMLLPKNNLILPMLSFGYARETVYSASEVTIENTSTKATSVVSYGSSKQKIHSMFGTFSLQFKIGANLSLKASVKTLIPALEFNKAKDNLKYLFGFTWAF